MKLFKEANSQMLNSHLAYANYHLAFISRYMGLKSGPMEFNCASISTNQRTGRTIINIKLQIAT